MTARRSSRPSRRSDRVRLPHGAPVLRHLLERSGPAYGPAPVRGSRGGRVEGQGGPRRDAAPDEGLACAADDHEDGVRLPSDLVDDLLAASGCQVEGTAWAALEVRLRLRREGRAAGDARRWSSLSPACRRAARVLLLASVVPGDRPPRPAGTDLLLLPLFPTFFSCPVERARRRPSCPFARTVVGSWNRGRWSTMNPAYPADGEGTATPGRRHPGGGDRAAGCIRSVEVLRGVDSTSTPRPCEPSRSGATRRRSWTEFRSRWS